ncbi:MAG: hypothetical protein HC887_07200 [Desulfobacteraceae bacterium]|nr:hypothetical protein [Desulfobacteraceae bacterium]
MKTVRGIEAVTPFVEVQTMIRTSKGVSGALVRGILPESAENVIRTLKSPVLSTLDNGSDTPRIILGKELAFNSGIPKGIRYI